MKCDERGEKDKRRENKEKTYTESWEDRWAFKFWLSVEEGHTHMYTLGQILKLEIVTLTGCN